MSRFTLWLVIIGGLQGFITFWAVVASAVSAKAARDAARIAERSLAITQRGHLRIEPYWIARDDEGGRLVCRYRYRVEGTTAVVIEDGHIRVNASLPFSESATEEARTRPVAAARVSAATRDVGYDVEFPGLNEQQVASWTNGGLSVWLNGEILYTDAFYPTTPKHRKYFSWQWKRSEWKPAMGRNDEEDEPEGHNG